MKAPATKAQAVRVFRAWINQRPGLDFANYGDVSSYRAEMRTITNHRKRALTALEHFMDILNTEYDALLLESVMEGSFSGRLQFAEDGAELEYCTGQYFPTEYRLAAAVCLEAYSAAIRQKRAALNPPTFTYQTVADVEDANKSIGHHWFDRATMRGFGTRIVSPLYDGRYFITSDFTDFDRVKRAFSIREAMPDGAMNTPADSFNEFKTKAAAVKAMRAMMNSE